MASVESEPNPNRVFVGSLPSGVTEEEIKEIFSAAGTIKDVTIMRGRKFGWVEFSNATEAGVAIKDLNGKEVRDTSLRVEAEQARKPRAPASKNVQLYVGNLAASVDKDTLLKAFSEVGEVVSVSVSKRGYGTVVFAEEDDAKKAIAALHDSELVDRKIVVEPKTPKKRRAAGIPESEGAFKYQIAFPSSATRKDFDALIEGVDGIKTSRFSSKVKRWKGRITFDDQAAADKAVASLDGQTVNDEPIKIEIAREARRDAGAAGGGGGGGGGGGAPAAEAPKKFSVFVGNLPEEGVTEEEVRGLFSADVLKVTLRKGRRYVIVSFSTAEDAAAALGVHGSILKDSELRVEAVKERAPKPRRARIDIGEVKEEPQANPARIFIGNIPATATADDLDPLVEKYGTVSSNKRSTKHTAFVTFSSADEAAAAVAGLNGFKIGDAEEGLNVEPAKPRAPRAPRAARGAEAAAPLENPNVIFIGNLPELIDREKVRELVQKYGALKNLRVSRFTAFAEFVSVADASKAIEALSGYKIGDAEEGLVVEPAKSKPRSKRNNRGPRAPRRASRRAGPEEA